MYGMYEAKYNKFTRILFYYGCSQLLPYFNPLIVAILGICNGNFDSSAFNLPLNVVVPFNTDAAIGWLVFWFFQFNLALTYAVGMILITTHFAGFCYYIIATCNHFDLSIDSISFDCERIQQEKNRQKHSKMWCDAREKLKKTIEMHVEIYE